MPVPVHRMIARWIIDHLVWDPAYYARGTIAGRLLGSWKLILAAAGATFLTWREWVEHHPPEIALVAVIHFVFVLVVIALVVHLGRWLNRHKRTTGAPSGRP